MFGSKIFLKTSNRQKKKNFFSTHTQREKYLKTTEAKREDATVSNVVRQLLLSSSKIEDMKPDKVKQEPTV